MLEIHSSRWFGWKKNHCSKFEKSVPYALLCQVAGLLISYFLLLSNLQSGLESREVPETIMHIWSHTVRSMISFRKL
jgi:hypothetical protein